MTINKVAGMDPVAARNGVLVFAAGMLLAGVSFVVEQAIIKVAKGR